MKKKCARAAVLFAAFMLVLAPQAHAGLGDEVNSTDGGIMFHAGVGGGVSMFGVIQNTSDNTELGTGAGTGLDLGMLLNYKMFAFGVNYTAVKFDTMEWKEEGKDYETNGGGGFSTLDATFGVKTFTEPGDMGFTHFYAGLRFWGAKRDYDYLNRGRGQASRRRVGSDGEGIHIRLPRLQHAPPGPPLAGHADGPLVRSRAGHRPEAEW